MPILFNTLLREAGFPLCDVRLVRHADPHAETSPYDLWLHDRAEFEEYQSGQAVRNRPTLNASYWAVFLGTPDGKTLFVGVYSVQYLGKEGRGAGAYDTYELTLKTGPAALGDLIGRLFVDWGKGEKAWKQYADRQDKPITELRTERVDE